MKCTIVRYKTKPETAQENERLIQQVFQELRAKSPQAVRYLALVQIPVRAEIAPRIFRQPFPFRWLAADANRLAQPMTS